jgi:hypothetical protein
VTVGRAEVNREIEEGHTRLLQSLTEYELRHLVPHLVEAGREVDVHRLLALESRAAQPIESTSPDRVNDGSLPTAVNSWYEAKEGVGDLPGFLRDVQLAWECARDEARSDDADRGEPETSRGHPIALQVRYSLIAASVRSLAGALPPALLELLVLHGTWPAARALDYARQVPNPEQRAQSLTAIAKTLDEPARTDVLRETLTAARQIRDSYWCAAAIAQVAPVLPSPLVEEAISIGESIEDRYWRAGILHLVRNPDSGRSDAGPPSRRADPADSGFSRPELAASQLLERAGHRERAARRLLPPGALGKSDRVDDALRAAHAIPDRDARREALTLLAREAGGEYRERLLKKALVAATRLDDASDAARSLAGLAVALANAGFGEDALEFACALPELEGRVGAILDLCGDIEPSIRRRAVVLALGFGRMIGNAGSRDGAFARISSSLAELGEIDEASALVGAIESSRLRAEAWVRIVELALTSPSEPLRHALEAILAERLRGWGMPLLARIAPLLSLAQLRLVLQIAEDTHPALRSSCLGPLAVRLVELGRRAEADGLVTEIRGEYERNEALAHLALELASAGPVDEALAVAERVTFGPQRFEVLARISARLGSDAVGVGRQTLTAALELPEELRCAALLRMLPHLPESLQSQAAAEARRSAVRLLAEDRDPFLAELAGCLADMGRAPDTLEIAAEVEDEYWRVKALERLAKSIGPVLAPSVLDDAKGLADDTLRARVLTALVSRPQKWARSSLADVVSEVLRVRSAEGRQNSFRSLRDLAPGLVSLGGRECVFEIAAGVEKVCQWWP